MAIDGASCTRVALDAAIADFKAYDAAMTAFGDCSVRRQRQIREQYPRRCDALDFDCREKRIEVEERFNETKNTYLSRHDELVRRADALNAEIRKFKARSSAAQKR